MNKRSTRSRIEKLEKAINPETRQPTYISVTDDQWDRLKSGDFDLADLGIVRPVKIYIGISPDDFDDDNDRGAEIDP